jgi:hypothetical protein
MELVYAILKAVRPAIAWVVSLMPIGELSKQTGFTLLGVLFLIAGLGVGLAALGTLWHSVNQHEKEVELLSIGHQYRRALQSYYQLTPGTEKQYPKHLKDLLLDPRFPHIVRHLRRLQADPLGGGAWVLLRNEEGGIIGLYSAANGIPRKVAGFPLEYADFEGANRYAYWVFKVENAAENE